MSRLTVTAYNVRFGDALLISVPERRDGGELVRHILIDVGNVLAGPGSDEAVYRTVVQDILDRLDGNPVDLYVMTHEHLDHVQGLLAAQKLGLTVPVDYAWLTASAREGYYDRFPEARKRLDLYRAEYERIQLAAERLGLLSLDPIRAFIDNNDPRSTAACIRHLRQVAAKKTSYVHRRFRMMPGKHHPFREARLLIWAPELDTSAYYGRVRPRMPVTPSPPETEIRPEPLRPPPGVDPEGFRVLVDFLQSGIGDNVLAIDRAANDTSVVLELEWRGWRLLFPGDAELKSWRMMHQRRQLRPVHFLKVSHHASRNGTPGEDLLEKILPRARTDDRPRFALVSTWPDTYSEVPDDHTVQRLRNRVDRVFSTRSVAPGGSVEIAFDG